MTNWFKRSFAIFLVLIVLFTGVASHNVFAKSSSNDDLVKTEMNKLKKTTLKGGYKAGVVKSIKFTGNKIPEIIAVFTRSKDWTYQSIIKVYKLNTKTKKWSTTYSTREEIADSPFIYATKGKLLDKTKEQVVLGTVAGSGAFFSPILIGFQGGKVKKLIKNSEEYFQGGVKIKAGTLYYISSTIALDKYKYSKGKFIKSKGTGADDRKIAGKVDKMMYLEKEGGHTVYKGSKNINLKVGQKIGIVRKSTTDSRVYGYRILTTGNATLDYSDFAIKAIKPGTETWHFEPDAYVDPSLTIKIKVSKK